ncbi:MAG: hypothetical protein KDA42_14030, partial [Planctomycetales bacterium]|nr:hypothetical protein [Planctomycetales bacterium]
LDSARAALYAVACMTRIDGVVEQANGECLGIGVHPAEFGPSDAAQGFALSLAAELQLASYPRNGRE